jgi:exodeoxyribonuclease VII large subunit
MLETLSFENVLARGYAMVQDEAGHPVTEAGQTKDGQAVKIRFRGAQFVDATIGSFKAAPGRKAAGKKPEKQQSLF